MNGASGDGGDASKKGKVSGLSRVRAHPILGWKGFEDVLESLPGETFDIVQTAPNARGTDAGHNAGLSRLLFYLSDCSIVHTTVVDLSTEKATTSVVFFLGGCTYTEIAALRLVSRQNKGK